jgi:hypothetical protein
MTSDRVIGDRLGRGADVTLTPITFQIPPRWVTSGAVALMRPGDAGFPALRGSGLPDRGGT